MNIEKMLRYDEGYSLKVYLCTQGFKTVGIGHNLDADPAKHILKRTLKVGDFITKEEATTLFNYDYNKVKIGIAQHMPTFSILEEKYQIVITNMVFQMGINGVLAFHNTLDAMQRNDTKAVVSGIENSKYYKQTTNRAKRMISIINGIIPIEYQ